MIISLVLSPLLVGLAVSFLLEQTLTPKPRPVWQRPFASTLIHSGLWGLGFAVLLLILQRPWFAVVNLLAFQLLLVLVNHAKFASLREPFICQDFEYFTDAIKHPRLYLPFFGIARTVAATLGFGGAFAIGLVLEPSLLDALPLWGFLGLVAVLGLAALQLLRWAGPRLPTLSYNPAKDLTVLGQWAFFYGYGRMERLNRELDCQASPFRQPPAIAPDHLAHIVTVQSESFFDPRGLSATIKRSVLAHFDASQASACQYGRLQVPAWGANTVRTESGFFTGLTPAQWGIHQFNPYRLLVDYSLPNVVAYLKQAGYRTLCIHPYHASFYQRDQVFPRLGFDEFIDLASFSEAQKSGQFTGDLAVADTIQTLLNAAEQPLFIFVITMENHGPLHLEQPPADAAAYYDTAPETGCNDLSVYLYHLHNADLMIKQLKDSLAASPRPGLLCWYGDHVPIMASVYQRFGEPDGRTDYFLWHTENTAAPRQQDLPIDKLAEAMVDYAGLRVAGEAV